jgi:gamma-glutamylcyclotransferase (GGCT)/AIG2-like uncharacterized protein YtfP
VTSALRRLFVYGTLRVGEAGAASRLLARCAVAAGAARVRGRLYDIGRYPGLVLGGRDDDWVPGDLYDLVGDAAVTLAALDDYEGCGAADPEPRAFARVWAQAVTGDGETVAVWLYEYRGDTRSRRRIPSWPRPRARSG